MINSRFSNVFRWLTVLALLPAVAHAAPEEERERYPPRVELPEGEGRELVLRACTSCHDLKGLAAYQGYWNRARWRSMVDTMVRNGAPLDEKQAEQVVDYLTDHFGPGTRD